MSGSQPNVAVILVNFNGWRDTEECILSLLKSTLPMVIVIVDNVPYYHNKQQTQRIVTNKNIRRNAKLKGKLWDLYPKPVPFGTGGGSTNRETGFIQFRKQTIQAGKVYH